MMILNKTKSGDIIYTIPMNICFQWRNQGGYSPPPWAMFICIVYLDYLIESMDARFNQRLIDVIPLEGLIPANLNMYDDENIIKLLKYMPKISMMIPHLQSELTYSYGGNNGVKILFQNRILLLIHSLIISILNLTLKYFYNYSPCYSRCQIN
jgi:hypothetical protein